MIMFVILDVLHGKYADNVRVLDVLHRNHDNHVRAWLHNYFAPQRTFIRGKYDDHVRDFRCPSWKIQRSCS